MLIPSAFHSRFSSLYSTVFKELAAIGISDPDSYVRHTKSDKNYDTNTRLKEIEWEFALNCQSLLSEISQSISKTQGLSIIVKEKMPFLSNSHRKKISLFSRSTIIIADGIDSEGCAAPGGEIDRVEFISGPYIGNCLRLAYKYSTEVKRGIIQPIPKMIRLHDPDDLEAAYRDAVQARIDEVSYEPPYELKERERLYYEKELTRQALNEKLGMQPDYEHIVRDSIFTFGPESSFNSILEHSLIEAESNSILEDELPSDVFRLSINDQALGKNEDLLKIGLVLPSLENAPLFIVNKLRQDYEEEFIRFQLALVKLSKMFKEETDERRFIDILSEVEENVQELNDLFKSIKKTHKNLRIVWGVLSIFFFFTISNPELMKHLHAIFSGIGTATFFEYFRNIRSVKHKVEKSPFYFPLLLTKYQ